MMGGEIEILRNYKNRIKMSMYPEMFMTVKQLADIVLEGGTSAGDINADAKISFFSFNDEFNVPFGKNSVFICRNKKEEELAKRAINHGAVAVLSDHQIDDLPCVIVPDIDEAFDKLCRAFYERNPIPATVIAGSIGKTTTTQMVEAVQRSYYKTFCAPINGNVVQYLGFMLQHTPKRAQWLVQEVDESFPNNASRCSKAITPKIAIITNVDKSHIGELGGEEAVMHAITSVTDYMPDDGYVIINADDENSMKAVFRHQVHTVAINNPNADCIARNIQLFPQKTVFDLTFKGETIRVTLNCPGKHNVYNAMMAFISGKLSGIPTKAILRGLKKYKPTTIRQTTYKSFGRTLYVDCFNASARSIDVALKVIDNIRTGRKGRRIAVLGDVLEIDGYEDEAYSSIARSISDSKTDILITYGSTSSAIWCKLSDKSVDGKHFSDMNELFNYVKGLVKCGDVVLFKASGGMNFEKLVQELYPITIFVGKLPYYIKRAKWIFRTL